MRARAKKSGCDVSPTERAYSLAFWARFKNVTCKKRQEIFADKNIINEVCFSPFELLQLIFTSASISWLEYFIPQSRIFNLCFYKQRDSQSYAPHQLKLFADFITLSQKQKIFWWKCKSLSCASHLRVPMQQFFALSYNDNYIQTAGNECARETFLRLMVVCQQ